MDSVVFNSSGQYASTPSTLTREEVFAISTTSSISIKDQLAQGERWFFTFFNNLESPIDNSTLQPLPLGYNSGSLANDFPLASKGVFEIVDVLYNPNSSGNIWFTLDPPPKEIRVLGTGINNFLLWKAEKDTPFVLIQDNITGVGPGCFVDQYTTDEILQNIPKITKEFGSNKQ